MKFVGRESILYTGNDEFDKDFPGLRKALERMATELRTAKISEMPQIEEEDVFPARQKEIPSLKPKLQQTERFSFDPDLL